MEHGNGIKVIWSQR